MESKAEYEKRINGIAVFLYIIFFFSDDTYLFGTNSKAVFQTIERYIMIPFCLYLVTRSTFFIDLDRDRSKWNAYFATVIVFVGVCIANGELLNFIVIRLLAMTVGFLVATTFSFDDFAEAFERFVYFVCICSFPLTLMALFLPFVVKVFPYITNISDIKFYTYILSGVDGSFLNGGFARAIGIFREPGIFQIFINISMMFELLYRKTVRKNYIYVFVAALLLTFSTAGYVVGMLIFSMYCLLVYRDRGWSEHYLIIFFTCAIPVVLFLIFGEDTAVWQKLFGKVKSGVEVNGSMAVRLSGVITSIEIALDNPVHGIGIRNMKDAYYAYTLKSTLFKWPNGQYANQLFCQFSCHGILFGALFFSGTYQFRKCFKGSRKLELGIFLAIALMYVDEFMQYSMLPYIIMFYGYGSTDDYWKEREIQMLKGY